MKKIIAMILAIAMTVSMFTMIRILPWYHLGSTHPNHTLNIQLRMDTYSMSNFLRRSSYFR